MTQVPVIMPQMGQSVAEGTILRWLKKVGEEVKADEILLEVETDKTNVEVESPAEGRLVTCLKRAGEIAAAGETIAMIDAQVAPAEAPVEQPKANAPHGGAVQPEAQLVRAQNLDPYQNGAPLPEIDRDRYSPYVLRLAMFNNVSLQDLEQIHGTGRQNRVTKNDVLQFLARRPIAAPTVQALAGKEDLSATDMASLGDVMPMSTLRRTIADHMVQSIRTSAHVTMVHAVDLTHVVQLRERIKDEFLKKYNARMTYTAVILFAASRVLKRFPKINASIHGTNIIFRKDINIGCAVALADESLVVPVVRNADRLSFPEIAQELARLIDIARRKQLRREDVDNGTFTISNFGSFGSLIGTPIINQPQVAILGMGAVHKAPVVVDGQIVIRDQLYLSFSFDHRIIDGELGGRFLKAIEKATAALTEESLSVTKL